MKIIIQLFTLTLLFGAQAQEGGIPEILVNKKTIEDNFLPDFSYAGYHFGEKDIPANFDHSLNVADYGAIPNDNVDDTKAFIAVIKKADELTGFVEIQIPSGKFNINGIIYINRSKTILKGAGTGEGGTVLHFQRPLSFVENPPELAELREYLVSMHKRQVEPENGVDILFSQYSWSGGYFWVGKEGARPKSYLPEYNKPLEVLTHAYEGKQGGFVIEVNDPSKLTIGNTYRLNWFNKDGETGTFLKHLYNNQTVKIGSHHWKNPDNPLVNQKVLVIGIKGNEVTIKAPLLHDVKREWHCMLNSWEHIEEVGIENLAFEFPISPDLPHHIDAGNNAIYLTSLMNGWVRNVRFKNADSGILTDDISNVTIENVHSHGSKKSHYSVAMGEVHNVLAKNIRVENEVIHPLSFNTRSTKCVYTDCVVEKAPILDQHSGVNEQNLFDNIKVYIDAPVHESLQYPLFMSGGAGYWAPAHAAFSTFYNIDVTFANIPRQQDGPILLNGVIEGVSARLIGVHANYPVEIDYAPNAYVEETNLSPSVKSLYKYQLGRRLTGKSLEM